MSTSNLQYEVRSEFTEKFLPKSVCPFAWFGAIRHFGWRLGDLCACSMHANFWRDLMYCPQKPAMTLPNPSPSQRHLADSPHIHWDHHLSVSHLLQLISADLWVAQKSLENDSVIFRFEDMHPVFRKKSNEVLAFSGRVSSFTSSSPMSSPLLSHKLWINASYV